MSEKKHCLELFEHFSELFDGQLDKMTGLEIEAHIETCPQCRTCWATFKKSIELYHSLGPEPVPPDFGNRLKAFIKENTE